MIFLVVTWFFKQYCRMYFGVYTIHPVLYRVQFPHVYICGFLCPSLSAPSSSHQPSPITHHPPNTLQLHRRNSRTHCHSSRTRFLIRAQKGHMCQYYALPNPFVAMRQILGLFHVVRKMRDVERPSVWVDSCPLITPKNLRIGNSCALRWPLFHTVSLALLPIPFIIPLRSKYFQLQLPLLPALLPLQHSAATLSTEVRSVVTLSNKGRVASTMSTEVRPATTLSTEVHLANALSAKESANRTQQCTLLVNIFPHIHPL